MPNGNSIKSICDFPVVAGLCCQEDYAAATINKNPKANHSFPSSRRSAQMERRHGSNIAKFLALFLV